METKKMRILKSNLSKARNQKGFSLIGILIASSMGVIVLLGLSQMLSNMQGDMLELKKDVNQKVLGDQIYNLLFLNKEDCQKVLTNTLKNAKTGHQLEALSKGGTGTSNDKAIEFSVLKDDGNKTFLDTAGDDSNKEKIKRLYDLEGHTLFQLSCEDGDPSDCDCSSGSYPCSKDWLLSLFTQSYKNNFPVFKKVFKKTLKIKYTSNDKEDFECVFYDISSTQSFYCDPSPICETSSDPGCDPNPCDSGSVDCCPGIKGDVDKEKPELNYFGEGAVMHDGARNDNDIQDKANFFGSGSCSKWCRLVYDSSFFGRSAGRSYERSAGDTFFGYQAGYKVAEAGHNSFFGYQTGKKVINDDYNSFFGYKAGDKINENQDQDDNSAFLNIANVIYGNSSSFKDDNDKYPKNNDDDPIQGVAIHGDLGLCDNEGENCKIFRIKESKLELCPNANQDNCQPVPNPSGASSREYKKNIVPFRDYQSSLEALLTTPLFTYQYKADYPEKQRMGVIAEELPTSLQLPTAPVQPDWVSIYGHLWAGIKALHEEMQELPLNPPCPPYQGGNSISEILNMDEGGNSISEILNMDKGGNSISEILNMHKGGNPISETGGRDKCENLISETSSTQIQQLYSYFEKLKNETHFLQTELKAYQQRAVDLQKELAQLKQKQLALTKELKAIQQLQ